MADIFRNRVIELGVKSEFKNPFKKFVKKNKRVIPLMFKLEKEVSYICANPQIGKRQVGNLRGIIIHDFKDGVTEYLIAYRLKPAMNKQTNKIGLPTVVFVKVGVPQNFFDDLDNYLN